MRFKINWASLMVGSKFTVFALFYFVFENNFPSTSPWGAFIWRADLTEGFLHYWIGGLIHVFGGAYTWRGLFSEFFITPSLSNTPFPPSLFCLRADISYFLCCTRKRDVCVTPLLIVFQRPAAFPRSWEHAVIG